VAGVTGDVIDLGLVRLYLMELTGTGIDLYSTGRIVVFSNSVLFQATTPLFKQLPGTQYVWHEVALALSQNADYPLVQRALQTVVDSVHQELGPKTDVHHGAWDDRVEIMVGLPSSNIVCNLPKQGCRLAWRRPNRRQNHGYVVGRDQAGRENRQRHHRNSQISCRRKRLNQSYLNSAIKPRLALVTSRDGIYLF
jgi:hypothetical protein